jgi:hypothetical protein
MKRKLPNDISRCTGKQCPLRDACARYIDIVIGEVYSYFDTPIEVVQGKKCDYFIEMKR